MAVRRLKGLYLKSEGKYLEDYPSCYVEQTEALFEWRQSTPKQDIELHKRAEKFSGLFRDIKPMDTLENGSRQRIDRIPIRGENVLKVLIVKALKINSRHRVFIAATINCIDNAAIAIMWLALKRSRIYIFAFIVLSNRPHIQPLSY